MGPVLRRRVRAGDGGRGARCAEGGVCGRAEGERRVCGSGLGREHGGAAGPVCAVQGLAVAGGGGGGFPGARGREEGVGP